MKKITSKQLEKLTVEYEQVLNKAIPMIEQAAAQENAYYSGVMDTAKMITVQQMLHVWHDMVKHSEKS